MAPMTLPPGAHLLRLACPREIPQTWPRSRGITSCPVEQPPCWASVPPLLALLERLAPWGSPQGHGTPRLTETLGPTEQGLCGLRSGSFPRLWRAQLHCSRSPAPQTRDKCAWPSAARVMAMWLRSSTGERHRGLLGAASLLWAAPRAERGSSLWLSGWPVLQPGHVVRRSQGPQTSPFPHILTPTRDSPLPRTLWDSTSIIS